MYKKLLPLLLLLLSENVLAFDFPIEITEYINDVKISADINKIDINNNLAWVPFTGAPPLSIVEALAAVNKYIETNTGLTETTLTDIELKKIPHHESHWHYLVEVTANNGNADGDVLEQHFYVVLMNGKVISAIKRINSIK